MFSRQVYQSGAANRASTVMLSAMYPSATRNAEERRTLVIRAQHVTRIANRPEQRPLGAGVDFLAQFADMNVDDVGLRIEVIVPDALEKHGARHDLIGMAHQVLEHLKLPRLQLHALP